MLATDHTQSEELVKRFEHEARTIARLDHPHIVSIFDVGRTSNGQIYYTMPHLPNGESCTFGRALEPFNARERPTSRCYAREIGLANAGNRGV